MHITHNHSLDGRYIYIYICHAFFWPVPGATFGFLVPLASASSSQCTHTHTRKCTVQQLSVDCAMRVWLKMLLLLLLLVMVAVLLLFAASRIVVGTTVHPPEYGPENGKNMKPSTLIVRLCVSKDARSHYLFSTLFARAFAVFCF